MGSICSRGPIIPITWAARLGFGTPRARWVIVMSSWSYICSTVVCRIYKISHIYITFTLTPKGEMVFFEFWSGSHFLSLHPNFWKFLGLILIFEIYLSMKYLFKIIWRCKGVKGKNKTKAARKKLFLNFFFQLKIFLSSSLVF